MNRDERRLILAFSLIVLSLLALGGALLRSLVARTLVADAQVHTAFLDLALRDRSRYLAETLQPERALGHWPPNIADILTRNHADYNRDIFIQLYEPDGQLVAASANTPHGTTLSPRAQREGTRELHWLSDETTGSTGRRQRLVTYPVYLGDPSDPETRVLGFAQAGLALPDTDRALARFTAAMMAALLALAVVTVAALRIALGMVRRRHHREAAAIAAAQHRFIGDAAHELGTPLAILRGEIDIALRRERSPQDYRATLSSCREEIERLSRLSENLLALATADAGHPLSQASACDAAAIARAVHHRFSPLADQQKITFSLHAPASLPWFADPLAIEQALGNLVINALQHTPSGEQVDLKVGQEGGDVVFTVTDTGAGIPPAHLPLLFERYHRVDKARSRAGGGGAGLGLAIVKSLVEAHQGAVSVTSTLGHGSTFTCRFPGLLATAGPAG